MFLLDGFQQFQAIGVSERDVEDRQVNGEFVQGV